MSVSRSFQVPGDRVLSYDEFRDLVNSQMREQQAQQQRNIAAATAAAAASGASHAAVPPNETPQERVERLADEGLRRLRQRQEDEQQLMRMRQRLEDELRAGLMAPPPVNNAGGPVLPGGDPNNNPFGGPPAMGFDAEAFARHFPPALRGIPRIIAGAIAFLTRFGVAVLGYIVPIVMVLMMVGFDGSEDRIWRIVGFFVALKVVREIANRVRFNVVIAPDQQQQQQQQLQQGNDPTAQNPADGAAAAPGRARMTTRELWKRRIMKTVSVFIVSLSPSFRLERLLRELHEEGIAFD